jgi:uncharacterized membrane protein YqiK
MQGLIDIGVFSGVALVALFTIGLIFARLYRRSSKEIAFVRTGFGGQKVIMNGGALVFPVLHETIPVTMNTLRLAVNRANEQALITRDRMRVDVVAEFYVRVQPTEESIANAAQTLGRRTMHPEQLKDLIEGKFVDALRSVAAEMSMEELHEKRVDFVQKVQQVVSEDLLKNGLELEAVSLTGLDQTRLEHFNPQNAFDAEGLTRLTEEIERRRKIRNDIEQDTAIQIKNKNLEAEKLGLQLEREQEYAKLEQQREIETRRASQVAEIAKEQAEQQKQAEQAQILAGQEVQQARITAERMVEQEKINKLKIVELSEQERDIAVAEKSKAQSEAKAAADLARAKAVQAEEQVATARAQEVAERQKRIELIEASRQAEREAIAIRVAAEAEKAAAADKAEALRELARADADKIRITAEGEAEAEKAKAAAAEIRYAIEAAGQRALNEAANLLSEEQIAMQVKLRLLENLQAIIHESVKPLENIDGIKIIQVTGLTGAPAGSGEATHPGNLADQVVNSALRYRAQAPLLDSLLQEVGLNGKDINGLTDVLRQTMALVLAEPAAAIPPAATPVPSVPTSNQKVVPSVQQAFVMDEKGKLMPHQEQGTKK